MTNHIEELKQLARKTQECEELKGIISDFISDNSTMYCYDNRQPVTLEEIQECMEFTYNAGLKYKQTLEAIEKECKFVIDNRECYDLREADRCELILNLINKAKGEGNVWFKNKRLKARLISIRLIDGRETDLHINKPVYDIKFELIGDK